MGKLKGLVRVVADKSQVESDPLLPKELMQKLLKPKLYVIRFVIIHIPYTIYHTPYTIYHTPYTIYHIPYAIYHAPYTIYHIPY
ncbi:hypothetical protein EON63_15280, partial [archaeon]